MSIKGIRDIVEKLADPDNDDLTQDIALELADIHIGQVERYLKRIDEYAEKFISKVDTRKAYASVETYTDLKEVRALIEELL